MRWLGIDIGGANLKIATPAGRACSQPFALWQQPEGLAGAIAGLAAKAAPVDAWAVTMTGELADCYATKRTGVEQIVTAVTAAAGDVPVRFYLTNGGFGTGPEATTHYMQAAASNWHALAQWTALKVGDRDAVLLDVGSTTTDIIPLRGGVVIASGATDTQRLLSGELVYLGAERTPISMLVDTVPYRGQRCPLARELFATMLDVLLVLGLRPESEERDTADGRPAKQLHALRRLARCLAACEEEFTIGDARKLAEYVLEEAQLRLSSTLEKMVQEHALRAPLVVVSGHGAPLVETVTGQKRALRDWLPGPQPEALSRCAPAFAVACLAASALPELAR